MNIIDKTYLNIISQGQKSNIIKNAANKAKRGLKNLGTAAVEKLTKQEDKGAKDIRKSKMDKLANKGDADGLMKFLKDGDSGLHKKDPNAQFYYGALLFFDGDLSKVKAILKQDTIKTFKDFLILEEDDQDDIGDLIDDSDTDKKDDDKEEQKKDQEEVTTTSGTSGEQELKNKKEGFRWLEMAAKNGSADACKILSQLYQEDEGLKGVYEQDLDLASKYKQQYEKIKAENKKDNEGNKKEEGNNKEQNKGEEPEEEEKKDTDKKEETNNNRGQKKKLQKKKQQNNDQVTWGQARDKIIDAVKNFKQEDEDKLVEIYKYLFM